MDLNKNKYYVINGERMKKTMLERLLRPLRTEKELQKCFESKGGVTLTEDECRNILFVLNKQNRGIFIEDYSWGDTYLIDKNKILEFDDIEMSEDTTTAFVYSRIEDLLMELSWGEETSVARVFQEDEHDYIETWDSCNHYHKHEHRLYETYMKIKDFREPRVYSLRVSSGPNLTSTMPYEVTEFNSKNSCGKKVKELVLDFITNHSYCELVAHTKKGEQCELFKLENKTAFGDFIYYMNDFECITIECVDENIKLNLEIKSKVLSKGYVVSYAKIDVGINGEQRFPRIVQDIFNFSSKDDAISKYNELTKPYKDKYGASSGYELKDFEYITEGKKNSSVHFEIGINGDDKGNDKVLYQCSLEVKDIL